MNTGLQSLLRSLGGPSPAVLEHGGGKRGVPVSQLVAYVDLLFPSSDGAFAKSFKESAERGGGGGVGGHDKDKRSSYEDYSQVSPGWLDALNLLELAKHAVAPKQSPSALPVLEKAVAEHVLNAGRFPRNPQAARLAAAVLERWRALDGEKANGALAFPSSLSPAAIGRLAYQLSQCDPKERAQIWQESLHLYQRIAQQHTAAAPADRATGATTKEMASVRHTVLVTLLRSGRCEEALRFFKHTLYQHDMPDSVSTGFLIQTLGAANRTEDVVQIFSLCVKLLKGIAARTCNDRSHSSYLRRLRKQWGTTLSMAMSVVCKEDPEKLIPLLEQLLPSTSTAGVGLDSKAIHTSLVLLDGNFLSAVQQNPRLEVRQRALTMARHAGLLDFFKLIRGLASRGKTEEALAVFVEAVTARPQLLSRKEIGTSRMFLLSSASYDRVEHVTKAVHTAMKRGVPVCRMNDAEAETVLSKSVKVPPGPRGAVDKYWDFSLRVVKETYGSFLTGAQHARRQPSLATLSFLMRNPRLPWSTALRLARNLDGLDDSHARHAVREQLPYSEERRAGDGARLHTASRSAPAQVLICNAASALLRTQGHAREAEELAMEAMKRYNASPSAEFLLNGDATSLRRLLRQDGISVDPKVLYHILHQTEAQQEGSIPRSLEVIALLMERACPALPKWTEGNQQARTAASHGGLQESQSWLTVVPPSVHCEALSCVRRCISDPARRWSLTMSYLNYLKLPPLAISAPQHRSERTPAEVLKSHYSAVWEAIITVAGIPAVELPKLAGEDDSRARKVNAIRAAVADATTRCDYLPPAHMLLANQVDRLLPPPPIPGRLFPVAGQATCDDDESDCMLDRCCAAQELVTSSYKLMSQRFRQAALSRSPSAAVEPVVVHGLLKLCCRVGEHAASLRQPQQQYLEEQLHQALGAEQSLTTLAAQLLEWQATRNGLKAVSSQSLHLLYSLCAASERHREDSREARIALRATQKLLELSEDQSNAAFQALSREERVAQASLRRIRQRGSRDEPVLPAHYIQFNRLFGWELGLRMWYEAFPQEVLLGVSSNPAALQYCLSLTEANDPL